MVFNIVISSIPTNGQTDTLRQSFQHSLVSFRLFHLGCKFMKIFPHTSRMSKENENFEIDIVRQKLKIVGVITTGFAKNRRKTCILKKNRLFLHRSLKNDLGQESRIKRVYELHSRLRKRPIMSESKKRIEGSRYAPIVGVFSFYLSFCGVLGRSPGAITNVQKTSAFFSILL